jgi:hypothetical protein
VKELAIGAVMQRLGRKGLCSVAISAMERELVKIFECLPKSVLVGIAGGHSNPNAPDGHMNLSTDFQDL